MQSRLKLDFSLNTQEERNNFVKNYLSAQKFTPTAKEIETIANYILWGKSNEEQNIQLESRHSTWSKIKKVESLDALIEQPTFSEAQINVYPPTYIKKEKLSRQQELNRAPAEFQELYKELWRQIDKLEYITTKYELIHGKRQKPIREALIQQLQNNIFQLDNIAERISQYTYLKLRHQMVELRKEQYYLKDEYVPILQRHFVPRFNNFDTICRIGCEIEVKPLGLKLNGELYDKIFNSTHSPCPSHFSKEELQKVSNLLWRPATQTNFNFTEPDHVAELINYYYELSEVDHDSENYLPLLLETLDFYISFSKLDEMYVKIIEFKKKHYLNQDIADEINQLYGKTYNANYISTILHQKIIPSICTAAKQHREIIENLFFPENFKKCTVCKEVYLLNSQYYVKKAKSKDGYIGRCKYCDKAKRRREKLK